MNRLPKLLTFALLCPSGWAGCREPWSSSSLHPVPHAKFQLEDVRVDGRHWTVREAGPLSYRIDLPDYSIFVKPLVFARSSVFITFEAPTTDPIFVTAFSLDRTVGGRSNSGTISSWLDYLDRPFEHGWPAMPLLEVYASFPSPASGETYSGSFTLVRRDLKTLRVLSTHRVDFRGVPGEKLSAVPDDSIHWWHRWTVKARNGTLLKRWHD